MNRNRAMWSIVTTVAAAALFGCGGSAPPPIQVSIASISPENIDEGQQATITAAVSQDTSNKGVTWTVHCSASSCGTVSGQVGTAAIYTAPTPLTANLSVEITATSVTDTSKSAASMLTVVAPPTVSTTSLPDATGGQTYSAVLQESGGIAPFTWMVTSGVLPSGLNLKSDGALTGSPKAGGTSNFSVQLQDSGNPALSASANLSITVSVLPLSITTTSLPQGVVDVVYKQQLQATGGIPPYFWTVVNGAVPSWATLNASTGNISGIPPTSGSTFFTVQAADSDAASPAMSTQAFSITTVPGQSTGNSELSGHYAFLFNGFDDSAQSPFTIAGSFTADGKGNLVAGIEDENSSSGVALKVLFTGSYNIASDNRGGLTIVTAGGSQTYALVLSSITSGVAKKAHFVEFDDSDGTTGQRGSGILRLQDSAAFSQSNIKGPYAFGFAGDDPSGDRQGIAGAFDADGSGTMSTGAADQNIAGTTSTSTLTGTYTSPSVSNGRAQMTMVPSNASTLHLSVYIVSATELLALSTDAFASAGIVSGTLLAQKSSSFDNTALNGAAVYYGVGAGVGPPATTAFAEIGLLSADAKGNLAVTFDQQDGGSIQENITFNATYAVGASGRVAVAGWYNDANSPPRILYLVDTNEAFFLDPATNSGLGFAEPQSAPPNGGFSNGILSGSFSTGTGFPTVPWLPNTIGLAKLDGSGSLSDLADISDTGGLHVDQTTTGSYSIAPSGRAEVSGLSVVTAGVNFWAFALALVVAALLSWKKRTRTSIGASIAILCIGAWLSAVQTWAIKPPPPHVDRLVFYVISPTKAILIEENNYSGTADVTVLEQ